MDVTACITFYCSALHLSLILIITYDHCDDGTLVVIAGFPVQQKDFTNASEATSCTALLFECFCGISV